MLFTRVSSLKVAARCVCVCVVGLDCRVWRSGSESKLHDETRTRCAHCIRDICGYSMNSHIRRCHFRCQRCASIFPSRAVHDEAMSQCDLCTVKDCKIMKHKLKAHADQMSTCDTCGVRGFNLTPHYRVNPACRPKPQVTYEAQPPTSEDLKKLKKPAFAVRRCTTCLADGAARMCHACIIYPFGIRNT